MPRRSLQVVHSHHGITAHRRKDAECLIFVEGDYQEKSILYRWRP